ncbi:MAG TPA: hypothetical protein VFD07_09825 [Candidatus Krumholzibacteria bacterium]|nr:hypothetical protein [Candidatus Krumholzibacteria bacterium]
MDARVPALSRWCVHLVLAGLALATARADEITSADSLVETSLESQLRFHDESLDEELDPGTLAALDALLLDPVEINHGALARLLAVPWLSAAQVDAIRANRPLAEWQDLARLPGWDLDLARSVRAFVRFARPRNPWRMETGLLATARRRECEMRGESARASLGLRYSSLPQTLASGSVGVQLGWMRGVAGDLRLGHAQGMLCWSASTALNATSAPLRRARGVVASITPSASHGLRGAALELGGRGFRMGIASGTSTSGKVDGGFGTVPLGGAHAFHAGLLQVGQGRWTSFGWSMVGRNARIELEVAPIAQTSAYAAAGEWRWPRGRFALRLQGTPALDLSPFAGVGASEREENARHALAHGSIRVGHGRFEIGVAHSSRQDSIATNHEFVEARLGARWQWLRHVFELRLRQRRAQDAALELETFRLPERTRQRGVVMRWSRRIDSNTSLAIDYRGEERVDDEGLEAGSAWQLHLQHRRERFGVQTALTALAVPSGAATPVIAEPSLRGGAGSRRLVGDGLRAALAFRVESKRVEAGLRLARSFGALPATPLEAELALRLRMP